MRDFTEIWQLQDTIITAVNACGYGVWDLHATSWGFHLELTEHLDDAEICNIYNPQNEMFSHFGTKR